jgi:hypothetical protein
LLVPSNRSGRSRQPTTFHRLSRSAVVLQGRAVLLRLLILPRRFLSAESSKILDIAAEADIWISCPGRRVESGCAVGLREFRVKDCAGREVSKVDKARDKDSGVLVLKCSDLRNMND